MTIQQSINPPSQPPLWLSRKNCCAPEMGLVTLFWPLTVTGAREGSARSAAGHWGLRLPLSQARFGDKMKTIEAIIETAGQVRLVEPVSLPSPGAP
jgi:hypothetical protein